MKKEIKKDITNPIKENYKKDCKSITEIILTIRKLNK